MADAPTWLPAKQYRASRRLRLFVFSLVVSTLLVSMFVVVFSFFWNEWLAPSLDRPPYQARVEFLLPAILLIAVVLHLRIWDAAEGRVPAKR